MKKVAPKPAAATLGESAPSQAATPAEAPAAPPIESAAPAPDAPDHAQRVREAAYRRFEARGSVHGHDEEDWLAAEREVRPPLGN